MNQLEEQVESWPVSQAAVSVVRAGEVLWSFGDPHWQTRIASLSKLLASLAVLVAVEEESVQLDEPAGPGGSTVRHLLAHASGLLFDEHRSVTAPGRRRIYSNAGIEQLAEHVARNTGIDFEEYQRLAVFEPLGLAATELRGSPARDVWSTIADLTQLALELLAPTLVSAHTFAQATSVQFPELRGVVPGLGSYDPNLWGLGFEIKGEKTPHWTGKRNTPGTFGHFGGTGAFLWVDPVVGLSALGITDRTFGEWSLEVWPRFSDLVLDHYATETA